MRSWEVLQARVIFAFFPCGREFRNDFDFAA
jgi:hypothetical protein